MEMMRTKTFSGNDNVRSRSNSKERVSLLGKSNASRSTSGLRERDNRRKARGTAHPYDEEKVSLLGPLSISKRNTKYSTPRKANNRQPWTMTRMIRYLALLVISATASFMVLRKESKMLHWEEEQNILMPAGSKEARCFQTSRSKRDKRCSCPDPDKALRNNDEKLWINNHNHMVSQAKSAPDDLDIVFFGDNMIEHLSGTSGLGVTTVDGMKDYFEQKFSKKHGGEFNAIALGSSGDTGPNLLWHWENGIQQAKLRPKLWFIMTGGNDLFINKCTDRFVMANILNVAKRIFEDQPDAKIVIHGISPRIDDPNSKSYHLGKLWHRAQGVNLAVLKWVNAHSSRIYFMNAGQVLTGKGTSKGRKNLDPHLIKDGINPTAEGVRTWGDMVVRKLIPILKGFDAEKHRKQPKPPSSGRE